MDFIVKWANKVAKASATSIHQPTVLKLPFREFHPVNNASNRSGSGSSLSQPISKIAVCLSGQPEHVKEGCRYIISY